MSWELSLLHSTHSALHGLLSPKMSFQSYIPTAVLTPGCVAGNIKRRPSDRGFLLGAHSSTIVVWVSEEWLYPNSALPKQDRGITALTVRVLPQDDAAHWETAVNE